MIKTNSNQRGFTIIELMIATIIFAILLLVITASVMQITRLYYKGQAVSRTQETARSVVEEIARAVQFSPGSIIESPLAPTTFPRSICIGQQQYSWDRNKKVEGSQHALMLSTIAASCGVPAIMTGREMLGDNMRVADLRVTQVAGNAKQYTVSARIVYGDNDLLCNEGACTISDSVDLVTPTAPKIKCKDIKSGSEFCAVAELSTIVERRLE